MRIVLPIDDSLVARIDSVSAKQPRVSWIRDAIEEKLALAEDVKGPGLRFTDPPDPSLLESPMEEIPLLKGPLPPTPRTALRGRVEPAKVSVDPVPPPPEITALKAKLAAASPPSPKRHAITCGCALCVPGA